jgi:1-deoxy-D-xylulose-5-phosphate synthase
LTAFSLTGAPSPDTANDSDTESLLETINDPVELRQLAPEQLPQLAKELRQFILEAVSSTGGHLAAGLGTIELTIALHYVFNTPDDKLVWDVGHQTYPHKILTGRRADMPTLRQRHGLAGFPKRSESRYDSFGVGHSSTSISAALGMAIAAKKSASNSKSVAIIGDGAMTAGMAFEALNHAGTDEADLLVVLNDNEMSISRNVGALNNHLARLLSGNMYWSLREGSKKVLSRVPKVWDFARRWEEHIKGMVIPGTLFEELGFNYVGPIDGHDLPTLIKTLQNVQAHAGPQFLHVVTRKGKGYSPAEENPCAYHGVSPFKLDANQHSDDDTRPAVSKPASYSDVFGDWLCATAAADPRLIAITPAMIEGSGMVRFAEEFPDQCIDVGIAEQHAVTFAAGLACEQYKPVVAIYSTFLQRAYDQLIHDVALQNLPVLFAIDRAGLVGADGPTHAGAFDLSFLRCIPNMVIMAPSDEEECRRMLDTGYALQQPAAVRYPRGVGPGASRGDSPAPLPVGRADTRRRGERVALLAWGSMLTPALEAGEVLNASVIDMRFIKPLDQTLISELAASHELLVTIEENAIAGGAGSAVSEYLSSSHTAVPAMLHLGIPDRFIDHGNHQQLLSEIGLDADGIRQSVERRLQHL